MHGPGGIYHLLYDYNFKYNKDPFFVTLSCDTVADTFTISLEQLLNDIEYFKFMHDNRDRFDELLLKKGFVRNILYDKKISHYSNKHRIIIVGYRTISVYSNNYDEISRLNKISTMYADLRNALNIENIHTNDFALEK